MHRQRQQHEHEQNGRAATISRRNGGGDERIRATTQEGRGTKQADRVLHPILLHMHRIAARVRPRFRRKYRREDIDDHELTRELRCEQPSGGKVRGRGAGETASTSVTETRMAHTETRRERAGGRGRRPRRKGSGTLPRTGAGVGEVPTSSIGSDGGERKFPIARTTVRRSITTRITIRKDTKLE